MKNKMTLDMQSVQGTMLLPLWGRAKYSEQNPDVLDDPVALDIVQRLDFDFTNVENSFKDFGGLCYIIRARKMDDKILEFIKKNPNATIVNIGCGLDTTFSRIDNGKIRWYNLDLPDAIEFRKTLIPDSDRNFSIPKSFLDQSWFEDIVFNQKNGILFLSAGVFYYFKEEDIQKVISAMSRRFPGGVLYFDAESKKAIDFSNRMVQKSGNHGAMMYFYVNNNNNIKDWSLNIKNVICTDYFKGVPSKKEWGFAYKIRSILMDFMEMMKFVQIEFKDK
ncbi:MAG: class I SAM-dependent methyltransferase [Methanimicrococcus sp.]|nr:class I SAM-dependent methyltransferase [Methanimicrococcus sp.]